MPAFSGFHAHDFGTQVRGTHWRHRGALGGQICKALRRWYGDRYQSWGVPGSNLLHIARRVHYRFPPDGLHMALFVAASPSALRWGAWLPCRGPHWQAFCRRLEHDAVTVPLLLYLLHAFDLTLTDLSDERGGALGGCWRYEGGELTWREACSLPRPALPEEIGFRLADLGSHDDASLSLYAQVMPQTALAWGDGTARQLLAVLAALVPFYELCVNLSE
ncbi:MAG: hypothetical protein D6775_14805 [Caldilineae bacterium]|nr:MAG: hypothetical protein D6775_14805 [Caldilineae bacterium]